MRGTAKGSLKYNFPNARRMGQSAVSHDKKI
jgi:hypothetical protein